MNQAMSKYWDHPRVTWLGSNGEIAYVDYTYPTDSYFISRSERGGFKVIPPTGIVVRPEVHGFTSFDAAIEYALSQPF